MTARKLVPAVAAAVLAVVAAAAVAITRALRTEHLPVAPEPPRVSDYR